MNEPEDDFEKLLEESFHAERFEEGQTVRGTVVAIRSDVAFLDVGGKGEATIDIEELRDDDGDLEVEVGDRVEAVVVGIAGGLRLSRKLARGAASLRQIEDAFRAGLPVEGKVQRSIKGGYEVRVGGQRAFCPVSQIDIQRDTEPASHEGRVYAFRILEVKDGGKNLVVSRRALQEEEQREMAEEVRRAVIPGAVVKGRVASVRDFGAFVDLGAGVQGLLHVSEMGWSRVSDPSEVVKTGDEITVKVLRVDAEKGRISLGLKQLEDDPWGNVADRYSVGQVVEGRIMRHTEFGAFVELEPGVEALAHISTFPPSGRADAWKESAPEGMSGAFEVLSVDTGKKRIGVAPVASGSVRAAVARAEIAPGARMAGKVERHEKYGVFVFLAPGRTGLIPLSETGVAREGDIARAFPVGSDVEVVVLEVDESGRRIRLSRKAVLEAAERAVVREYSERQEARPGNGFGSMADKLRDALKK